MMFMPTIYRKYRPSTFADVTGQEPIVTTIKNEITLGKVAHAYLFSGPRGVGKTTLARLLAKAVNCPNRKNDSAEPCNQCPSCQSIGAGRYIDVIEVDAASQTGVDNVRENIIENAQFKPTQAANKVFIIDEVHMLSTSAFNALLKTLEEPPARVIFILATTELHKLPATVISRCERFSFKKIGYDDMMKRLKRICKDEDVSVDKTVLERVINKSDGCLRDAESLLGQILSLNLKSITGADAEMILPVSTAAQVIEFLDYILKKNPADGLALVHRLVAEGVSADQLLNDLIETLRALLLVAAAGQDSIDSLDYSDTDRKKIMALAKLTTAAELTRLIDLALRRRLDAKTTPMPELPLELFAVSAASAVKSADGSFPARSSPNPPAAANPPAPPVNPENNSSAGGLGTTIKHAIAHITGAEPLKTTLDEIKTKWPALIDAVSATNHSLTYLLSMCALTALDHRALVLTVPYAIHKDKLQEQKNRRVIEEQLQKLFNEKISFSCAVLPEPATAADVSALAAEFGGEIIG